MSEENHAQVALHEKQVAKFSRLSLFFSVLGLLLLLGLAVYTWMEPYLRQERILEDVRFYDRETRWFMEAFASHPSPPKTTFQTTSDWATKRWKSIRKAEKFGIGNPMARRDDRIQLTEDHLRQIGRLPFSKKLSFNGCDFPPSGMEPIFRSRSVVDIRFFACNIHDGHVRQWPQAPQIRYLDMHCRTTEAVLPELFEKMPGLESLWFAIYSDAHASFSDDTPPQQNLNEHIERLHMEKLERLCLYTVSDKSLKLLKCCPHLKHLTIQSEKFTREGLSELAALAELETLSLLHHRWLKDDDLAPLAEMKSLRSIGLAWLNVEGHGLRHLKDLPNLEEIRLYGSFNDSSLESLERFLRPMIVFLLMSKSNISEEALAEFRRKHPLWTILSEKYDMPLRLEPE